MARVPLIKPANLSDPAIAEIVAWSCVALGVLVGDIANQWYELAGRSRARAS